MIEEIVPLDGNAAAGRLSQLFAFDVTLATITCGGCARKGPLAELRLYGRGAGLVLRCRHCDAVNVRLLESGAALNLDLSGCALVRIQTASDRRSVEGDASHGG
jgi:hypothetical protein